MAIFRVPMNAVAVSAQQDFWHIKAGASRAIALREINIEQSNVTTLELWKIVLKRHTSTVTQGSGGSTPTPVNCQPGGASSGVTAHMNDTTKATAGTLTILHAGVFNLLNGFFWMPPPEHVVVADISTGLVVTLDTTPLGSTNVSGTLIFEELGL